MGTSSALPPDFPERVLELMRESVLVTDAQLDDPGPRILYANPAFTRMTGYLPAEVIGKTPRILQGPETDPAVLRRLRASLESSGRFRGQAINYRKNGEAYVQNWYIRPLKDGSGVTTHYVAVQQEMQAGVGAQGNMSVLGHALESGEIVAGILTGTHHFSLVSEVFARACGHSREELTGTHVRALEGCFIDATAARPFFRAIENRTAWQGDLRLRDRTGRESVLAVGLEPVFVAGGPDSAPSVIITGIDETQSRRYRAIADSVSLSNAIADAVGGLRHELGNPVNSLGAALTVLARKWRQMEPETVDGLLRDMGSEISRMKFLIRSLRGFAANEKPKLQVVDISALFERLTQLFARAVDDIGCRFDVETQPGTSVYADPRALLQVFINLVGNALDALEGRTDPRIELRVRSDESTTRVELRDNGPGMDAETLEEALRPFYTTKATGTGLGLPMSRSLLAQMGADFGVSSQPGEGTAITIAFEAAR